MANRARGEIELCLNGESVIWRLRWKDIAEIEHALEQICGKKVTWWQFRAKMSDWDIRDLALVVWAGLRHTGKYPTTDDLMSVGDFTLQDSFIAALAEQIMSAVPDDMKKKLEAAQQTTKN